MKSHLGGIAGKPVEHMTVKDPVGRITSWSKRDRSAARRSPRGFYVRFGKRALDLLLVVTFAPVIVPVAALVGLLARMKMGRPVLFRQSRPGLEGRPFVLLKFRTMSPAVDRQGTPVPRRDRVSRFGDFLRSTSLDELPELFNVLTGDMSLVGPRPLLMRYLDRYTPEQSRRHDVRPGLTGWAQIHGRNETTWDERFAHDLWYVENLSFRIDLQILFATAWQLVRRDGGVEGAVNIGEYMGPGIPPRHEWDDD